MSLVEGILNSLERKVVSPSEQVQWFISATFTNSPRLNSFTSVNAFTTVHSFNTVNSFTINDSRSI